MAIESQRTIYPGQGVRVTVNITDATNASALTDPTTLIATLQAPGDDVGVDYTYGTEDELGRSSTCVFYFDFTPDAPGVWRYAFFASGNIAAVHQGTVKVLAPLVTRP